VEERRQFIRVAVVDWNAKKMFVGDEGRLRTRRADVQYVRNTILLGRKTDSRHETQINNRLLSRAHEYSCIIIYIRT